LIVTPGSTPPRIQAGASGAHLLDVTRSAVGAA